MNTRSEGAIICTAMITDHQTKALLLAIGEDPAPAIACINHLSPELLCFFLAESQKETIESLVQPQISKMPQRWDWILTTDPESFAQSHQAITKKPSEHPENMGRPAWRARHGF